MTAKAFFVNILFVSLILLIAFACLAFYQYNDGYKYAEEQLVSQESYCGYLSRGINPYWHYFEIIGCKVQVQDRLKKLESRLGINASDLSKKELRMLLQEDRNLQYQQALDLKNRLDIERCNSDIENCTDNSSQRYGYESAPYIEHESHTLLTPEECEEVDNAGFLPECREL